MREKMRLALKVVSACMALLLIAAALVLLTAHWQIRSIEPELPTASQLRALLHRPDGPTAIRYINTSEQKLPTGALTHSAFIVTWANGEQVMIDAGMSEAGARQFGAVLKSLLDAAPVQIHGTVVTLLDKELTRIAAVAYTHLHRDHTEGTAGFCRARKTALLLQTQWQREQHNFTTRAGAETVGSSCLRPTQLQAGIIQSSPRFPGLGIVALGGHTPDSTLFAVPVGDTLYLLSGDTTNTKAEIRTDAPKALLYSYVMVPEHVRRTAKLRQWLAKLDAEPDMRVVVSHDLQDIRASGMQSIGPR